MLIALHFDAWPFALHQDAMIVALHLDAIIFALHLDAWPFALHLGALLIALNLDAWPFALHKDAMFDAFLFGTPAQRRARHAGMCNHGTAGGGAGHIGACPSLRRHRLPGVRFG